MTTTGVRASFKSFDESTKEDWAAIMPQLQVTQSMVADRVIEQLGYLRNDYGGFPVDRLEHSLQTARRDSRLGYEWEQDYIYTPDHIEEKIKLIEVTLKQQIPDYRKRHGL